MKKVFLIIGLFMTHVACAQIFCHPGVETPGSEFARCDTTTNSNHVCQIRLFVSSNQTVSFYLKDETRQHEFGTIRVGQSLQSDRCFADENIIAVTWDENAKTYKTKTLTRNSNVDTSLFLEYPRDFNNPYIADKPVLCQTQILNDTNSRADFYAGHATAVRFLMRLEAEQRRSLTTPCYRNQSIVALSAGPIAERLNSTTFNTTQDYSNVNQFVFVEFSKDFSASTAYLTHLFRRYEYDLLKDEITTVAADPKQAYQNRQDQKNDDNQSTDSSQTNTQSNGLWTVVSGVIKN